MRHLQSRQAGGAPTSTSSSPSRHVSGGGGTAGPKSRIIPTQVISSNSSGIRSAASTSSIPTPYLHGQSVSYAARRDAEKSASAEAHLGQLRLVSFFRANPPSSCGRKIKERIVEKSRASPIAKYLKLKISI